MLIWRDRSGGGIRAMDSHSITLGTATNHYSTWPVSLSVAARLRHTFILGQTGVGKTTLMQRMAVEDLKAGHGFAFLDPHSDASQELLEYIPPHRMDDVIYLRPADKDRAFGFNILEQPRDGEKDRLTQEVVSTFRYRWADSFGPRMENIYKHTVRGLLDVPSRAGGVTLLSVPMLLSRPDYRKWVLRWCQSRAVIDFFRYEFDRWNERQISEFVQPILNKVDQFLLSDVLRNVLGQTRSTIDLDYIMNNQKVLIVDLDKGAIGEDDANTIGSLLVTGFQMAALRRSRLKPHQRTPFFLKLDEFANFTTGSFASILSESRKYGLGLEIASQYVDQIENDQVRAAVFGNCGNYCCFRVGPDDARAIAPTLDCRADHLENLSTGQIAMKYLQDGHPTTATVSISQIDPHCHQTKRRYQKRRGRTPADRARNNSKRYTTLVSEIVERQFQWSNRITENCG